jgi:tetratricopeptide (TPR) repeat protein
LREAVWLREASKFAVGDETDPLRSAERLFDWTVRNVQLIPDDAPKDERLPYLPWHVMLLGRGTALDRGWLFVLLARQQGLDVVLLAPAGSPPVADGAPTWPALVHEGQLYLFDERLAVAVPGPGGKAVATLAQVQKDDALLRALDLPDGNKKYPLTAAEAEKLTALVEASSPYLAPRFARLENLLTGDSKLVLSIDRDALVAKVRKCAGVSTVKPWPLRDERFAASRTPPAFDLLRTQLNAFRAPPIRGGSQTLRSSPLWKARMHHITGNYGGGQSGTTLLTRLYQEARPSEAELVQLRSNAEIWNYAYRIKQNATYWLGLVSYDLKNYDTAVQYFDLVLKEQANGGWTSGARYNLGRTHEAAGRKAEAIATYRGTYLGVAPDDACLARARRLEAAK